MADDPRAGELTTTNYHWTKPTVGQSDDAWGGYLNADLDSIDSIVHSIDTRVIPPGGAIVSDTPPASPTPGMLWFDSVGGQTYVWYVDPNTSQWVLAVSGAQGPQGPAGPNTLPMGVTDGSNAAAGQIGEVITVKPAASVPLTNNVQANGAVLSLTAGDWDVRGCVSINASATVASVQSANISLTSAVAPNNVPFNGAITTISGAAQFGTVALPLASVQLSFSTPTNVYLNAVSNFGSGTNTIGTVSWIQARRVR